MSVTFKKITPEESWKVYDGAARRLLRISGEEFSRRWDAGEYKHSAETTVMQVAMLRPDGVQLAR